jgi:hypothetical protein
MAFTISSTHSFMLSSSSSILNNQVLCDFLKDMDEAENRKLTEEEEDVKRGVESLDVQYSWNNIFYKAGSRALGVGGLVGVAKYAYDHSPLATIKTDESALMRATLLSGASLASVEEKRQKYQAVEKYWRKADSDNERQRLKDSPKETIKWFVISSLCIGCFVVSGELIAYSGEKNRLLKSKTASIIEARDERLQQKIRLIEERILAPQNDLETVQLPAAKDFFDTKHLAIKTELANVVRVEVSYV